MTFRALQTDPNMDLREMLHRISDFSATLRTSYITDGVEFADHNEVEECGQNARKLWSLVWPLKKKYYFVKKKNPSRHSRIEIEEIVFHLA
jgi:hypothetical protein